MDTVTALKLQLASDWDPNITAARVPPVLCTAKLISPPPCPPASKIIHSVFSPLVDWQHNSAVGALGKRRQPFSIEHSHRLLMVQIATATSTLSLHWLCQAYRLFLSLCCLLTGHCRFPV